MVQSVRLHGCCDLLLRRSRLFSICRLHIRCLLLADMFDDILSLLYKERLEKPLYTNNRQTDGPRCQPYSTKVYSNVIFVLLALVIHDALFGNISLIKRASTHYIHPQSFDPNINHVIKL